MVGTEDKFFSPSCSRMPLSRHALSRPLLVGLASCNAQTLLHLIKCQEQHRLRPHERCVIVWHPLVLADVIRLACMPRSKLAVIASYCRQTPGQEKLLAFQILRCLRLLEEAAIVAADHRIEEIPLRLLAWLQQCVSCLELLVCEVLCGVILCVFVISAPVAVLAVSADPYVAINLLHALQDLPAHGFINNRQRVAKENRGSVRVTVKFCRRYDLVGENLGQTRCQVCLEHIESVSFAWSQVTFLRAELFEDAHGRQTRAQGGCMLGGVLLPMTTIQVVPGFDDNKVIEELT
mmetsp:Transcript_68824/g.165209  ORF Transcript_68824/g.165209 Transcript_68824/m.165209 type:complete len:292 (-) Transcript_68824:651-1526(-)